MSGVMGKRECLNCCQKFTISYHRGSNVLSDIGKISWLPQNHLHLFITAESDLKVNGKYDDL